MLDHHRTGARVPPSLILGLTTGLLIFIVDAAAFAVPGSLGVSPDVAENVDLLVNVLLYAALGFRLGRTTGVVREAAEGGVIAGLMAATMWCGFALVMNIDPASGSQTREIVGTYALNVAIGGVVALLSGWYGSIARESGSTSRRP
jgi:hypothetical protein